MYNMVFMEMPISAKQRKSASWSNADGWSVVATRSP